MKKHKFLDLTDPYCKQYDCVKCDRCVCLWCIKLHNSNEIINGIIWIENKNWRDSIDERSIIHNRNILLNNFQCSLSDEEYIIKSIIE